MRPSAFVLRELVKRDLKSRYAGSLIGFSWSLLQPLWQLALFTFVFSTILKVPLVGERTQSFPVFLFAGLLPWTAIHEGLIRSSQAIIDNAPLVKRLRFPSEILVASVVVAALVQEGIAALGFGAILIVMGELAWGGLPWLLLAVPLQAALTFGLGLLVAALQVFLRDVAQALSMLLVAWFYVTPIVFPANLVPPTWRALVDMNPLTALVGLYRSAFFGSALPSGRALLVLCTTALIALAGGMVLFRRWRRRFPDEI